MLLILNRILCRVSYVGMSKLGFGPGISDTVLQCEADVWK